MSGIEGIFWCVLAVILGAAVVQSPVFGIILGGAAVCIFVAWIVMKRGRE